jgi:hypothetical protein
VTHVPPFTVFVPADGNKSAGVVNKWKLSLIAYQKIRSNDQIKSFAYLLDDKSGR